MVAGIEPDPRLIEIFFSTGLAECEQQTLTLSAVGIHSWTIERDGGFAVLVRPESFDLAYKHLSEVARESLPAQDPAPMPISHPNAWAGSVLYAIVLMGVAYAAGIDLFGVDWLDAGSLNGTVPQTHEWWRVITALTLHTDVAHLVGNLVFGIVLGYFAALAVGGGVAWAGILLGAAMGNGLDAWWMPESHSSIGASTAVFAALGLLSAYAWRRESATNLRRVKRWAPLVAGIMLLGLTGVGGERTDIVAHVTGFASGGVLGAILGKLDQDRFTKRALQLTAASLSLAVILGAWMWVLQSG